MIITNLGGRTPVWLDYDNDHRLDMLLAQYGGAAKLFHQNNDGTFTEAEQPPPICCACAFTMRSWWMSMATDAWMCCARTKRLSRRRSTTPRPFRGRKSSMLPSPAAFFPLVKNVVDSAIADFNNDGRMDMFVLGGVQNRPSSVVQGGPNRIEALLAGGSKGFKFVSTGTVTFTIDWNKAAEGAGTDITKIQIGSQGTHPNATTFTLDPSNASVSGMPPAPDLVVAVAAHADRLRHDRAIAGRWRS